MRYDRVAVYGTVTVIAALSLATGPGLGLLSVPSGGVGSVGGIGNGQADVSVLSAPERGELAAGPYGDVHYLAVPDSTVSVSNHAGSPLLTAAVDIDGIGYSRSTVYALDETGGDTRSIGIERASLNSTQLDRDVYEGRYRLVLRDGTGRTVVYDEFITVEVTE